MTDGEIVGAEHAQQLTEIKSAAAAARIRAARVIWRPVELMLTVRRFFCDHVD